MAGLIPTRALRGCFEGIPAHLSKRHTQTQKETGFEHHVIIVNELSCPLLAQLILPRQVGDDGLDRELLGKIMALLVTVRLIRTNPFVRNIVASRILFSCSSAGPPDRRRQW